MYICIYIYIEISVYMCIYIYIHKCIYIDMGVNPKEQYAAFIQSSICMQASRAFIPSTRCLSPSMWLPKTLLIFW